MKRTDVSLGGHRITRREALGALGTMSLAAVLAACSRATTPTSGAAVAQDVAPASGATTVATAAPGATIAPAPATSVAPALVSPDSFDGIAVCELTPEQAEGPFYVRDGFLRSDITEGRAGRPMVLGLRVVDAACVPIGGALVDVWHADADGDYSAFIDGSSPDEEGPGSTFLRGSQVSNAEGIVAFETVYPGWYPGRAVHIHVKAHVNSEELLTTQIYFPDEITDRIYEDAPYSARGQRTTRNADDRLTRPGENVVTVNGLEEDILALMVLGVAP